MEVTLNNTGKITRGHITATRSVMAWWRHQVETVSASLVLCEGNPPVTDDFHSQRSVKRSFDVFFDVRPNKRLNKQSICRWFDTPWRSLQRCRNGTLCSFLATPKYVHINDLCHLILRTCSYSVDAACLHWSPAIRPVIYARWARHIQPYLSRGTSMYIDYIVNYRSWPVI